MLRKLSRWLFAFLLGVFPHVQASVAADFTFAQITDIHLSSSATQADLRATLKALRNLSPPPDFVLVTGDISEMARAEELRLCKSLLDSSGFNVYVLLGNHDVRWSSYTHQELAELFPGVPHFAFVHENIQFIGINTALPLEAWGDLSPAEQRWLAKQLAAVPRDTPRLLFMHHPVFYPDRDFTCDTDRLLHVLRNYNVRLLSAGHGHRYRRWQLNGLPFVMAPAVVRSRGFLLFRVHSDSLVCEARLADSDSLLGTFAIALHSPTSGETTSPLDQTQLVVTETGLLVRNLPAADSILVRLDHDRWQRGLLSTHSTDLRLPIQIQGQHTLSLRLVRGADSLWQRDFPFTFGKALLWSTTLHARVQAPLALAANRLFVATSDGRLTALDPPTGHLLWQQRLSGSVIKGLAANATIIVTATLSGVVEAFRTDDGTPVWRFDAREPIFAPPALASRTAYIGTSRGNLLALELETGTLLWRAGPFGMIQMQPVLADTLLLVGSWDGFLHALSATTGRSVWRVRPTSSPYCAPATASPVIADGFVFFCAAPRRSEAPGLYKASLQDGRILWTWPCACHYASPTVTGDSLLVAATLHGHLLAFQLRNNEPVWDRSVATAFFDASPVNTGPYVSSVDLHGRAVQVLSATGHIVATAQVGSDFIFANPVAKADTLWVADLEGNVLAVKMAGRFSPP